MRRGILSQGSELIKSIGHSDVNGGTLEVQYVSGGEVFQYSPCPFSVFKKIVSMKHPGTYLLKIRDKYTAKKIN